MVFKWPFKWRGSGKFTRIIDIRLHFCTSFEWALIIWIWFAFRASTTLQIQTLRFGSLSFTSTWLNKTKTIAPLFARVFSCNFFLSFVGVFAPNYPLVYVHEMLVTMIFFLARLLLCGAKKEQQNQIKMVGVIKNGWTFFPYKLTYVYNHISSFFPFILIVVCVDFLTE